MASESRKKLLAFLRKHVPYRDMGAFAMESLAASLTPLDVAGGNFILEPTDMPPDLFLSLIHI